MALDDDIKTAHDDEIKKLKELKDKLTEEEGMHTEALRRIGQEKEKISALRDQMNSTKQQTTSSYF